MSLNADVEPVTEMEEPPTFAPSIPVPNVQEMVEKNPLQAPKRYLRNQEEVEKVNYMPHLSSEIPVIDLALLSYGKVEELLKLDIACKEWGFFQLVNHGVQKELLQRMKGAAAEFFKLPIQEKDNTSEQVLGLSPHSDTSTINLLMQDDDTWSNGKYKSVEHTAVTSKNKGRTSHALFLSPQDDVEVEPLDHMIDAQNSKLYQKVRYGHYLRQSMKRKMEGKAHTDVAMIEE